MHASHRAERVNDHTTSCARAVRQQQSIPLHIARLRRAVDFHPTGLGRMKDLRTNSRSDTIKTPQRGRPHTDLRSDGRDREGAKSDERARARPDVAESVMGFDGTSALRLCVVCACVGSP